MHLPPCPRQIFPSDLFRHGVGDDNGLAQQQACEKLHKTQVLVENLRFGVSADIRIPRGTYCSSFAQNICSSRFGKAYFSEGNPGGSQPEGSRAPQARARIGASAGVIVSRCEETHRRFSTKAKGRLDVLAAPYRSLFLFGYIPHQRLIFIDFCINGASDLQWYQHFRALLLGKTAAMIWGLPKHTLPGELYHPPLSSVCLGLRLGLG